MKKPTLKSLEKRLAELEERVAQLLPLTSKGDRLEGLAFGCRKKEANRDG